MNKTAQVSLLFLTVFFSCKKCYSITIGNLECLEDQVMNRGRGLRMRMMGNASCMEQS